MQILQVWLIQRTLIIILIAAWLVACSNTTNEAKGLKDSLRVQETGDNSQLPRASSTRERTPFPVAETLAMPRMTQTNTPTLPAMYFTPSPEAQDLVPTPSPRHVREYCSPLEGHTLKDLQEILTNPFNPPPPGKDTGHHGVDFAYYRRGNRPSILGVPVHAVMAGRVAAAIQNRIPYGNMVIIETPHSALSEELIALLNISNGRSLYLLYAHMNEKPTVELGDWVTCGQALGEVGNTPKGWSSDPHLHLEGRIGPADAVFRGMAYYDTGATLEEMENYRLWRMSGEFTLFDPMVLLTFGLNTPAAERD